jgi:RsiW-degrading membrane proteinase PrsW (M82 family)
MTPILTAIVVGLLPVLLFLLGLIYLDSYKLLSLRRITITLVSGGLSAGLSYLVNVQLLRISGLDMVLYARYTAPAVEEVLKALLLVWAIRSQRVGFLVDAAILGFAVGAGFAVIENVYYIQVLPDAAPIVWIIRGCGTAIMHGGTAAIFAIVSKSLSDRGGKGVWIFLPGLLLAIVLHSFFNHFFLQPLLSTLIVLLGLPPLIVLIFRRSERSIERWLGVGFDADTELLQLIHSGEFSDSRVGRYLHELTDSFRGEVVVDMLCYLRLHVELSLRAKGELMMRESGFKTTVEPEVREMLEELRFLEGNIGVTGKLAMLPFLQRSRRDLWQFYVLMR